MSVSLTRLHVESLAAVSDATAQTGQVRDEHARRLSRGVARGERAAVTELYEAWFDRSLAIVMRYTGRDESFGLDVVQDAMVRMAGRMPALETEAELERWMRRVLTNASLDALRREARRGRREREAAMSQLQGSDEMQERIEALRAALMQMEAEDRALLRVRFDAGQMLRQIGIGSGASAGWVHRRLQAAMGRLRKRVEESNDDVR